MLFSNEIIKYSHGISIPMECLIDIFVLVGNKKLFKAVPGCSAIIKNKKSDEILLPINPYHGNF